MEAKVENSREVEQEVLFWIKEVELEIREIERQQIELVDERDRFEAKLNWLKGMLPS